MADPYLRRRTSTKEEKSRPKGNSLLAVIFIDIVVIIIFINIRLIKGRIKSQRTFVTSLILLISAQQLIVHQQRSRLATPICKVARSQ